MPAVICDIWSLEPGKADFATIQENLVVSTLGVKA